MSEMIRTPWCYMPPEMHFESPMDLKDAFWAFHLTRIQDELRDLRGMQFLPPANKFEKLRRKDGKFILLPTFLDYSYVFRGQGAFYQRCVPTLYRKKLSAPEVYLERLRCVEFELFLKSLPQVEDFERNNIYIDYMGLCQHYGFCTEMLDMTNSIDVALFFAMCDMDEQHLYKPKTEVKEYIGYIYAVRSFERYGKGESSLFDGKLSAIGMQPFTRPGEQRAFSLHMNKGEELKGLIYSFSYSMEDSKRIWSTFGNGKQLWHDDFISETAKIIQNTLCFTYHALNLCQRRYMSIDKTIDIKKILVERGYSFSKHQEWSVTNSKWKELKRDYDALGGFIGLNEVVQRSFTSGGITHHCLNTTFLSQELLVRFPISGCPAPKGYVSDINFEEGRGGSSWGFSYKTYQDRIQTQPNPDTGKVEKWKGNWRDLKIDYNREKKIRMGITRVSDNTEKKT